MAVTVRRVMSGDLLLGALIQYRRGWLFNPRLPHRTPGRVYRDTAEEALPKWVRRRFPDARIEEPHLAEKSPETGTPAPPLAAPDFDSGSSDRYYASGTAANAPARGSVVSITPSSEGTCVVVKLTDHEQSPIAQLAPGDPVILLQPDGEQ